MIHFRMKLVIEEYPFAAEQGFQNKADILNPTLLTISVI